MQPSQARLYRPGISFRFVRSPEAPKITRTHESAVGSGSCDKFSRGLAWIIADINLLSIDVLDVDFESTRKLPFNDHGTTSRNVHFVNTSPNIGRPLFDCSREASSWITS